MKLPNFLILGAAKSGTTSLAEYLDQHPEVFFCPTKEPNYFAFAGETLPPPGPASPEVLYELLYKYSVTDYGEYLSLFESVGEQKAIGEGSVRYLYFEEAPRRIKEKIPDVRLIVILREPVSRLYSHYCMNVRYQLEPLSLPEAMAAEKARRDANWGWDWHYANVSLYCKQIQRYFDLFDREQVKVVLYDDFVNKPLAVFQEICRHIGVSDRFVPDMSQRGMVAYRTRNFALDRWLHWPSRPRTLLKRFFPRITGAAISRLDHLNRAPAPRLDAALRQELTGLFREEVEHLGQLLDRKIPWCA